MKFTFLMEVYFNFQILYINRQKSSLPCATFKIFTQNLPKTFHCQLIAQRHFKLYLSSCVTKKDIRINLFENFMRE